MAEENVQKLLDMLYEMIDEAKNAPLSNDKCVLNRDEAGRSRRPTRHGHG